MKGRIIIVFLLLAAVFCGYAQNQNPMDIILLLDTSSAMFSSNENVNNYITGKFLSEYLRIGDTFHLLPFSDNVRVDAARRINGRGDVETIIGRMLLQYPLVGTGNLSAALVYAEQYITSLPNRQKKIVVVSSASSAQTAVNAAKPKFTARNTTLDLVLVTPGQSLGNLPSSGRPPSRTAAASSATSSATARPAAPQTATPAAQSTAQPSSQTTTQASSQTAAQTPTQPATQSTTQTATPSTTPSTAQSTTQASSQTTTQTPTQPATQSTTQTSSQTAAQTPQPATTQTTTQSTTQASDQATSQPATQTATQTASEPASSSDERSAETSASSSGGEIAASDNRETDEHSASAGSRKEKTKSEFSFKPLLIALAILAVIGLILLILFIVRNIGNNTERTADKSSDKSSDKKSSDKLSESAADKSSDKSSDKSLDKVSYAEKKKSDDPEKKKTERFTDHSGDLAAYAAAKSTQRTTPYSNRPVKGSNGKPVVINSSGSLFLNLFVEDQNTSIGKRNIHSLKSGYSLTVGGGNSDFLIFLVQVPPKIGEIKREGSQLTFIPKKPKYFPDTGSNEIKDCINKTIRIISDKNYELRFRFEMYEDPLVELNRLLNSVRVPG